MAIKEVSAERYNQMLEILPPAIWLTNRYLVGEPSSHRRCKITKTTCPTYAAFFFAFGRYFESDPMTVSEFRAFKDNDLPLPK